jgi:hypothetical protein
MAIHDIKPKDMNIKLNVKMFFTKKEKDDKHKERPKEPVHEAEQTQPDKKT